MRTLAAQCATVAWGLGPYRGKSCPARVRNAGPDMQCGRDGRSRGRADSAGSVLVAADGLIIQKGSGRSGNRCPKKRSGNVKSRGAWRAYRFSLPTKWPYGPEEV